MELALNEIKKERDLTVKDIQKLSNEIDGFKIQIERRHQEIAKKEQLVSEYNQIIEKLKGVTV